MARRLLLVLVCALAALLLGLLRLSSRGAIQRSAPDLPSEEPAPRATIDPAPIAAELANAPASERRSGSVSRLRGRAIERSAGRPMAGVTVRCLSGNAVMAEAQSGEDGLFELAVEPRTDSRVEAEAPAGFWIVEPSIVPKAHHWAGAPLEIVLAPADLAPFRGRALDSVTGDPVPRFVMRIFGVESAYETVQTDDGGAFVTEGLFPAGVVRVQWNAPGFSSWIPIGESEHAHRPHVGHSVAATIRVHVGPTYRLRLKKPPEIGIEHLGARLVPGDQVDDPPPGEAEDERIEPGDPPWVRFPPHAEIESSSAWLVVRTHGGAYEGRARVATTTGIQPTPVEIRLEALATIRGTVVDASEVPVAGAEVRLVCLDGASSSRGPALCAGTGLFLFEGVPPGDYALNAVDRAAGSAALKVTLQPGEEQRPLIRLEPYPIGGDVEGIVRSTTGRYQRGATLTLRPTDAALQALTRHAAAEWMEEGGGVVGRFRFQDVPRGSYVLTATLGLAPFLLEPEELAVAPPAAGLEFLVRDEEEALRIGIVVVDAGTGAVVEDALLCVTDASGAVLFDGPIDDWPARRKIPVSHPFVWSVRAAGRSEAHGDRSELRARSGSPIATLIVVLEAGE